MGDVAIRPPDPRYDPELDTSGMTKVLVTGRRLSEAHRIPTLPLADPDVPPGAVCEYPKCRVIGSIGATMAVDGEQEELRLCRVHFALLEDVDEVRRAGEFLPDDAEPTPDDPAGSVDPERRVNDEERPARRFSPIGLLQRHHKDQPSRSPEARKAERERAMRRKRAAAQG